MLMVDAPAPLVCSLRRGGLLVGLLSLLFLGVLYVGSHFNHGADLAISDQLATVSCELVGMALCALGLRRPRTAVAMAGTDAPPLGLRTQRYIAVLLGLGLACIAAGDGLLVVYEVVIGRGRQVIFPSWADVFYLASYPLLFGGVLVFTWRGLGPATRGRVFLDSLVLFAAVATFSWYYRIGPAFLHQGGSFLDKLLDAAYPLCDLALFSSLLLLLGVKDHRALRPFAAVFGLACAIMAVPDSILYYQSLQDTYTPEGVFDLVWPLGCMLLGLGVYATRWLTLPAPATERVADVEGSVPALWQALLPYLALPAVAALLFATRNDRVNPALTGGAYIGACAVVVLVVMRQVLALRESLYRARSLERLNRELRALTVANDELNRALLRQAQADVSRLADLDRLRNDFIAAVSHDLQTPLTSIRAGLVMLDASVGAVLAPDERDLFSAIRRNVDRLRLRVNALLTANQLDAGGLLLDTACLDLSEIARTAATSVQPLFQEKGQSLDLDLPQALPVEGDAHRLEEVVVNLLANAHRHTPPGTQVVVSGRMRAPDIQLDIADDGPGIPSEELEAIFARFHRRARGGGGSGLGLSIARSLVELHGGRLWAESCLGGGTTFHLSLPARLDGRRGQC